jgi:hypothetical protein
MKLTTLAQSPVYYADTIKLIEKSFDYTSDNKFDVDFYPLMNKENHINCHLLVSDNRVIAHIGVLLKTITIDTKTFKIAMYGGIAVDENERGKGHFKEIFNEVLSRYSDNCLHLLWSDHLEMYEKFNFYPAIEQFEYNDSLEDAFGFEPTTLKELSQIDIMSLDSIYSSQDDFRIDRTMEDWKTLSHITSTQLYIKRTDGRISNYFFMNKGEDLTGVVIEVGCFDDFEEIKNFGVVWSPEFLDIPYEGDVLYAAVLRIGEVASFKDFITTYTDKEIEILNISEEVVDFIFEENNFSMSHNEFITGVFGPSRFNEIEDIFPLYISGLDSI